MCIRDRFQRVTYFIWVALGLQSQQLLSSFLAHAALGCTRSPLASVLTAELCCIGIAGHKTLLRQHCWTIYIFQNRKAALDPHFLVACLLYTSAVLLLFQKLPTGSNWKRS